MSMMNSLAKLLIVVGAIVTLFGVLILFSEKLQWIGRLPGDIYIEREGLKFYFPITTCLLISLVVSALWYIFTKR